MSARVLSSCSALQSINSLKKLCNHPGLVHAECAEWDSNEAKSAFAMYPENYVPHAAYSDLMQSSKLAVLDHLLAAIKQENNKVVVVSNYIQTLDMLSVYLNHKGYQYLRLDGQTKVSDRGTIVDRFNATYSQDAFVFLLSAKAGGVRHNTAHITMRNQQPRRDDHCQLIRISPSLCYIVTFISFRSA